MIESVKKRTGEMVPFEQEKITWAIFKAAEAVGGSDFTLSARLSDEVVRMIGQSGATSAYVEDIQDAVEKALIENKRPREDGQGVHTLPREAAQRARNQRAHRRDDSDVFRLSRR